MLHHHLHQQHKLFLAISCVGIGSVLLWCLTFATQQDIAQTSQPRITVQTSSQLRALVVPHHDIVLEKFPEFYGQLTKEESANFKKVILLSPNHFQPERLQIVQRGTSVTSAGVVTDEQVFLKEHGVNIHLPFIKKQFPQAELTTLLFTRNVTQSSLDELIKTLNTEITETPTLVIASVDFSHYLSYQEAEQMDAQTLALIQDNRDQEVLRLSDDYLDCPACLYVVMNMMKGSAKKSLDLVFHGNSAQFLRLGTDEPTTSYFVLKW
jgi:MEMO1 family protein